MSQKDLKDKIFQDYLKNISAKFALKGTSEMGYRTDFENLLKSIFGEVNLRKIQHDPKATDGNKPDFIVLNEAGVPLLYIEAKNIGVSLDKVEKSEQMRRYFGYDNLILTDYTEFRFYRYGKKYDETISIAHANISKKILTPVPENFDRLKKTVFDFISSHKEAIKSGEHLAKIMGGKAQRIRDNVREYMSADTKENRNIRMVYETFKKLLVHDLSIHAFADMYSQTLVYGLFVARFHDPSPETFSRQEARDLIPASNPLLRHFFDHIVGPDFDKRLEFIVNELCIVFSHSDVSALMKQYYEKDMFGEIHEGPDPVIHFYEDFLKEYDPELRKKLGAFYTPLPVVNFIVRSVDYLLEKEFGLPAGLADTSKLPDGRHKVQILDPAVGTGTFITQIIRRIYDRITENDQKGRWPKYVFHDLLPRIHGFELMMASYTIAHLKLSLVLKDTGFKYFNNSRLGIYLTNSLEEGSIQTEMFHGLGLADSIAEESREANEIKNNSPIMVVIGNPPYSVISSNKGSWILNLIKSYKENLNEKNIQPLSDDYIKFIRLAEHFIEKNKTGIVAMITNNSFLDGIIHRQMRKHLLDTFDDIYILDLHGNSKKREKSPDGSKDENVFDIMQGVAISIFIRKSIDKQGLGMVFHKDLYGLRKEKFNFLNGNELKTTNWKQINNSTQNYFFVRKDFTNRILNSFSILDLFPINSISIVFGNKEKLLSFEKTESLDDLILVNAFDLRFTKFSSNLQRSRETVMKHINNIKNNYALLLSKQSKNSLAFISKFIVSKHALTDSTYSFPLYLCIEKKDYTPNLNNQIVSELEKTTGKISPEEILDYIYAVLHSPLYREKYKEFLKIDFPRIPYPKNKKVFDKLVSYGTELRNLHLLESPALNKFITNYPVEGTDEIVKVFFNEGRVYINKEQYFGNVPENVWNFYIGGYQPAQKWLKDRKGRTLANEDFEHYQKMIVAMNETIRIMNEIDKIYFLES